MPESENNLINKADITKEKILSNDESMWNAFQKILMFISLGLYSVSLHSLWSSFIQYWFPSYRSYGSVIDASYYGRAIETIDPNDLNYAIAGLLVSAPFFISLFILTNKKYTQQPNLKNNTIKKVLTYNTLIATFLILLFRTISAITTALNDQFTLNFGLNLILTFSITGAIFLYYLYEVRFEKKVAPFLAYLSAGICIAFITLVTLGIGLFIRYELKQDLRPMPVSPFATPYTNYATPTPIKPVALATDTNLPSEIQTVQGIDFTIEKAEIYNRGEQKILEMSFLFESNMPCPLEGGAVCGINSRGIQATDQNGFILDRVTTNDSEEIKDRILKPGQKGKGLILFKITDLTDTVTVTYSAPSGETSQVIVQFAYEN